MFPFRETIDPDLIKQQLQKILVSETFVRSERSREMLSFLVEKELAGEASEIKGFVIAQDVFGRSDDFDPAMDSLVRVQAGRLRDLLETYYRSEGAGDRIRIEIPRGTYVPAYCENETYSASDTDAATDATDDEPSATIDHEPTPLAASIDQAIAKTSTSSQNRAVNRLVMRNLRAFWYAIAAIFVLLFIIAYQLFRVTSTDMSSLNFPTEETAAQINMERPSLIVSRYSEEDSDDALEATVQTIGAAVARFQSVSLIRPLPDMEATADYRLIVGPSLSDTIAVELVHQASGTVIWQSQIDQSKKIDLNRVLTQLLPTDGTIYVDAGKRANGESLVNCASHASAYFHDQTVSNWRTAFDCTSRLIDIKPDAVLLSLRSSLKTEAVVDALTVPETITLDDALADARLALYVQDSLPDGHRALSYALLRRGDNAAGLAALETAVNRNPYDLALMASYAYALYQNGDCRSAIGYFKIVTSTSLSHPNWWDYHHFLCALDQNDAQQMIAASNPLASSDRSYYVAARIVAAHKVGDVALRDTLLAQLKSKNTGVTLSATNYYSNTLPSQIAGKMLSALSEAGFAIN